MSLSREKTMRVALRFVFAAALTIGALAPASAQETATEGNQEAAKASAARIPASQLRFYCFSGPFAYSIGAVTCLTRGQWGTCRWTNQGSNHSAPANRAYWVASIAPFGSCP
jgi:hypothetical protein